MLSAATLILRRNIFLQFSCSGVMMFMTEILTDNLDGVSLLS